MCNADYADADFRLNIRLTEVWGASETPLLAWINVDTGKVVELWEDLEPCDLDDADLLIDDPDLLADLLLD